MKITRRLPGLLLLCTALRLGAETPAAPVAAPAAPVPAVAAVNVNADYRITARDTVQFSIYNQLDMTTVQRITSTGEIRLPLIGTVKLAELTLREAELLLESLYRSGGFFVDPQAILSVQKYGDRFVSVLGQVKNPERIALASEDNTIGILQAITQVGGFTRVARTDAVQVLRNGATGQEERLTVNMDEMLRPKAATNTPEFQLKPGDIVFVPERVF